MGCAAPLKEIYHDTYFEEDGIYQNSALGFSLQFPVEWYLFTDPNTMSKPLKALARDMLKDASELLFVGTTSDGLQGVKGVAAHLNANAVEYAKAYYQINKPDMVGDSGLVEIPINEVPMVVWEYSKKVGTSYVHYIEFFFSIRSYTVRICFWADQRIFNRFMQTYFDVIKSIELNAGS